MFIIFFAILLNVVAIVLLYHCLPDLEKKEKIIFIVVGIAVMYILTSIIYWISSKGVEVQEVSERAKNMITFIFVPLNGIIILPILAKSYNRYIIGDLESDKLRNRIIIMVIALVILMIIECSYFKNIQNGIIQMLQQRQGEIK